MKTICLTLFIVIFFSCTKENESPKNAYKKSVAFNCESRANFQKISDTSIIEPSYYFTLKEKNFYVITRLEAKMYNIDLNSLKIISEKQLPVIPCKSTRCGDSKWWIVYETESNSTAYRVVLLDTLGQISTTSDVIETVMGEGIEIASTIDNGFILTLPKIVNPNESTKEMRVIRYDKDAKVIWDKNISEITNHYKYKLIQVTDGFLLGGSNLVDNKNNAVLIKLNNNGDKIWQKTISIQNNLCANIVKDIKELPSKDYALLVMAGNDLENLIFKTDSSGNVLWKSEQVSRYAEILTLASNEILISSTQNNPAYQNTKDIVLTCIAGDGQIKWKEVYVGGSGDEYPLAIMQNTSGYFIIGSAAIYTGTGYYFESEYYNSSITKDYFIKTDFQGKACN